MYSKAYFVGGLGSVWNTPTKASLLHFRQGTLRQKEKKEKKGTKEDSNSNSNSHKLPKVATSCQSVTVVLTAHTVRIPTEDYPFRKREKWGWGGVPLGQPPFTPL